MQILGRSGVEAAALCLSDDADVIAAADEAGLAMVFTGHRHFRH